jgi:SAM-dependent methyltransferase
MNDPGKKQVLNAGSGAAGAGRVASVFPPALWNEVRLDIEPRTRPDIVGSFADMRGAVADARFDALYSSHAIEHLYAHEVIPALREFLRVLKPDGFALVSCPDLAAIARQLLDGGAEGIAYQSPAGPIRPIDMLYGHSESIGAGHIAMAHNTGFTAPRLGRVALASGFAEVRVIEGANFDLWALLLGPRASLEKIAPLIVGPEIAELVAAPVRLPTGIGAGARRG